MLKNCIRTLILCLPLVLTLSVPVAVYAAEVSGLYQAVVMVKSRDDETERTRAFRTAMQKVLVKVSGRLDTLENPLISRALGNAQPYVDALAYKSLQDNAASTIELQVSFFQSEIQNLLASAGIAVWPRNRPDTLLWVVIQDESGLRTLAGNTGNNSDLITNIQNIATEKGVPLIVPIMDLEDQMTMRPESLWNFDTDAINTASKRYQAESVLAVRIYRALGGEVIARAVHLFRGHQVELDGFQADLNQFLQDSVNMLAQELAGNYAILLSGVSEESSVSLLVEDIGGIADYAGLLKYLETLTVVKEVRILEVKGKDIEFQLNTGGQLRQLIEAIALERKLLPLSEPERQNQQVRLHYKWQSS